MTDTPQASRPIYDVLPVGEPPTPSPEPPPPPREALVPIRYDYVTNTGTLLDVLA